MNSPVRLGVSPFASTPKGAFSQRFWGFISLQWNPGLRGLSCSLVVPPGLSACKCGTTQFASCHLAASPLRPGCPSLPLLPVWMNVSSLTPWLLDFHTVWFSGSCVFIFCFWICYPSFGCVRRQSVSKYVSILQYLVFMGLINLKGEVSVDDKQINTFR